jgi:UDP-2-acetamido-2-deoxy-ribo-hexuluronate aminotransferase
MVMAAYDGWDREYQENKQAYLDLFDRFMSQMNYENNEDFERRFAERIGRQHVVSVANATDALHFALLSYGIGPGDEVLVTDFSWISSSSCINMAGATPVFCDIDLASYQISFESIKRMYSEKTKAIIYVHLFGNMVDTSEIQEFCKEKNIIFIEDASQSLGSSLNGVKAGTIGDCSVYSFNSNKVIAGINGGGVLLTDNEEQAKLVQKIRRHGKDKDFELLGFNSRMYVLNAEIINLRLASADKNQQKRNEIAELYNQSFKDLPVYTQLSREGLNHNYHKYTIRFQNKEIRKRVKDALKASVHYEKPLSDNSMYDSYKHRKDNCVNSKLVSDTILSLPIHAWLTDDEIFTIISTVKNNF